MTRRPRFVPRSAWWCFDRTYRRLHGKGWLVFAHLCPVCGVGDTDCLDRCGCYARDPSVWRERSADLVIRAVYGIDNWSVVIHNPADAGPEAEKVAISPG